MNYATMLFRDASIA